MGFAHEHNIKAICFDIDGTFYPKWKMDIRLIRVSLFHLPFALKYNKLRKTIRTEDGLMLFDTMSYEEISKRGARFFFSDDSDYCQNKFREKEKHIFHDYYLKSYSNIKPARNVQKALEIARKEGYRLAALSDFPIGVKLKAMKLDTFFDFVVSSEDLGHFKPSATPFKVLADKLDVKPEQILYVGDSYKKDVIGANNAGMYTCLIFSNRRKEYTKANLCMPDWATFIDKVLEKGEEK